jgi:single-strand DNA-binding protein
MNKFCFTGNLGREAEVRYTQSGTANCSFPVAVSSGYGDKKKTTWVRCTIWGKRAESKLPEYLTKGTQVAITGELSTSEYTPDGGEKRFNVEVNVSDVDLIGGKPASGSQPASAPAQGGFEDDIPFAPYQKRVVV